MFGTENSTLIFILTASYLLGSVPTAVLVCRAMGLSDPRQQGSGNPGATNVLRVGNRPAAAMTLLGDLLKGALAITLARWFDLNLLQQGYCGLAALGGHIFSIFLRFQGGKGVATLLGISLMLNQVLGLLQCCIWISLILIRKISSLAAIGMALISPIICWFLEPGLIIPMTIMSFTVVATHHRNIRNLFQGSESRL